MTVPNDFGLFGLAVMRRDQVFNDEGRGLGVNVSRRTAEVTRDNWLDESQLRFIDPGGAGHYAKMTRRHRVRRHAAHLRGRRDDPRRRLRH
jgi:6-phosphogluconate dehydrogenase